MLHGLGLSLPFSTVHCPAPFKPLPVISQPTTVAKESSRYRRVDETETDGREISVLQHTTNCHEMYWSTISWNLVVCSKSDISSPSIYFCLVGPYISWGLICYCYCYKFSKYADYQMCPIIQHAVYTLLWEFAATSYSAPFTKFAINLLFFQGASPLLALAARVAFSQLGTSSITLRLRIIQETR